MDYLILFSRSVKGQYGSNVISGFGQGQVIAPPI